MRYFFSSAEASGDDLSAHLAREILALDPAAEIEGIGGRRFKDVCPKLIAESSSWGVLGIVQGIKVYHKALRGSNKVRKRFKQGTPGVFIPIDAGFLNLRMARAAKEAGWKVIYCNPPGSWRRDRQGADLPKLTDAVITPFEWSAEILNSMGAKAFWFGHPIKEMLSKVQVDDEERTWIAVLPGSRRAEVDLLMPIIAEAVRGIEQKCLFSVAPTFHPEELRSIWKKCAPERVHDEFETRGSAFVLKRAQAGIICSGTATLEAALCGCPHVVAYRISTLSIIQAKIARLMPKFISQPNILLDEMVVPELVHYTATPENVRSELLKLLSDETSRANQLSAFSRIDKMLGGDRAITQAAATIVELARG